MSHDQLVVDILKGYRDQIEWLCNQNYDNPSQLKHNIRQMSCKVDEFLLSHETMKKTQRKFNALVQDTIMSLSPITPFLTPLTGEVNDNLKL